MLPSIKEEKTQAFTTIAFTLLALSIFGFFAINPTVSTIVNLQKQLEDNTLVDQQLQQKITNLSSLQQQYNVISNDIPIVLNVIPQDPLIPSAVGKIQALATKSNAEIQRVQVFQVELPKKGVGNYSFVFTVDAQGDYKDLINFMNSFSDFDRLITIDSFSLAQNTEKNNYKINIKGKIYFKQ